MTPEQFTYWLQGYAELNAEPPTADQWQSIREHLATVFQKVTPPIRWPSPLSPAEPFQQPYQPPYKVTCSAGGIVKRSGDNAMTTC